MKHTKILKYLPLLANYLSLTVAISSPTVTPTATSNLKIRGKRDEGVATITLLEVSHYLKAPEISASATGTQLFMVPGDKPVGGIDIYMGPDLLTSVKSVISEKCMNGTGSECESSVAAILPQAKVDFRRRVFSSGVDVPAFAIIAIIVGSLRTPKRDDYSGHWHIEEYENWIQWEGMKTKPSPTIVVVSESGDPNPYTIVSSTPAGPTVTSMPNGDVILKFDQNTLTMINDWLSQSGVQACRSARKRGVDFNCLVELSGSLLQNVIGGPLADLGQDVAQLPQPGGPNAADLLRALVQIVVLGKTIFHEVMGYLDFGVPLVTKVELMVFWVLEIVTTSTNVLQLENTLKTEEINIECRLPIYDCYDEACRGEDGLCTIGDQAGCVCGTDECPPDDRMPSCKNCGGNNGVKFCTGLVWLGNLWSGCRCVVESKARIHHVSQIVLQEDDLAMMKIKNTTPSEMVNRLTCNATRTEFPRQIFQGLPERFCNTFLEYQKEYEGLFTVADYKVDGDWSKYKDQSLALRWKWDVDESCEVDCECSDSCESIFETFLSQDCASEDTEKISVRGDYKHDCGTASYSLTPPPVAPYREGDCKVEVRQYDNTKGRRPKNAPPIRSTFSVKVAIYEASAPNNSPERRKIGSTFRVNAGPLSTLKNENTKPLELQSLLENDLVITPLKNGNHGGYVRFTIGGVTWSSNLKEGVNHEGVRCDTQLQEWNTRSVVGYITETYKDINCDFPCMWGGGKPSNGVLDPAPDELWPEIDLNLPVPEEDTSGTTIVEAPAEDDSLHNGALGVPRS